MVEHLANQPENFYEAAEGLLRRTDQTGTSDPAFTVDELIRTNRAGQGESRLSLEELLVAYGEG